jgi:hypothetical protein
MTWHLTMLYNNDVARLVYVDYVGDWIVQANPDETRGPITGCHMAP